MTDQVEFGIGLRRMDEVAEDARAAEALGYQFVSAGEHVLFHGPIGNGLIQLAAAAGATKTIKLMSAITLVPLYPAALLAKQVATLDTVSHGRFNLVVGVGSEFAREFEACGVPVNERGARYGDGWWPYMYTLERLAGSLSTIGKLSADENREAPVKPGLYIFFAVHEDRTTGIKMATERLSVQYNQDFSSLVGKYAVAGNPDDCIARLREYIDAGARTIILNSACPAAYVEENERLLAQAVLPALRQ